MQYHKPDKQSRDCTVIISPVAVDILSLFPEHCALYLQMEDIALCEGVQRGLESPAYSVGRYAPSVEMAMHHFHCLLHANLSGDW
jgi:hypothetical protein